MTLLTDRSRPASCIVAGRPTAAAVLLLSLGLSLGSCAGLRGTDSGTGDAGAGPLPSPARFDFARVDDAVSRGCRYLVGRQEKEGYWLGTLYNDSSVTGIYILLALYTGHVDSDRQEMAVRYLLGEQAEDGGWEQYPGSGGNLDVSLINVTALRATGIPADHPAVEQAQDFVRRHGGTEKANFFTKIFLAMFGQVPWHRIPWASCRWIQHEDFIYRQGLPRVILIPYMVLYENRRVLDLPGFFTGQDAPEGALPSARRGGDGGPLRREEDRLRFLDALRDPAHQERCLRWIEERQEEDGTWAGIVQATAFSAMALTSTGRPEWAAAVRRAVRGVEAWQVSTGGTLMQPFSQGPVMDTALSLRALLAAGVRGDDPVVRSAAAWLATRQSLREADWRYGNPDGTPGGWPFQFFNSWHPDVDDTAMVLAALGRLEGASLDLALEAGERGIRWLVSMQNRDGGFPVWDRNNWVIFNLLKSVFDVGDYSHGDVTARVLVALAAWKKAAPHALDPVIDESIRRARAFLLRAQKGDGSWYGRWGANYTYGTGQVLEGLLLTGSSPGDEPVRKAAAWLFGVQNPDGGWGEGLASYETGNWEPGESTVAQTSAVLAGLLRAGVGEDPRFAKGIRYLLERQREDGSWQDRLFFAVNVPRAWYGRYDLLPTQSAVIVLAGYGHLAFRDVNPTGAEPLAMEEPR